MNSNYNLQNYVKRCIIVLSMSNISYLKVLITIIKHKEVFSMKKEVILVPKDKCPLDVLAEMGERTKNAWIFLHQNATEKLKKTADECKYSSNTVYTLLWNSSLSFETIK